MEPVRPEDLASTLEREGELFTEFVRGDALSLGVYRLDAGTEDPQEPHTEDEAYHVISGRARIRIDGETYPVESGDTIYVERGIDHQFTDIEQTLITLVVFAPPRKSLTP